MAKIIALIVSILMFVAGIVLVALNIGVGLLLLIVGLMASIMMGIVVGSSGGFYVEGFASSWHHGPQQRRQIQKHKKDIPVNPWDQITEKKQDK